MLGKNITLIFGPPGTGKTTSLIDVVGKHINEGTPFDKIAYVSFTRRAASEARERVAARFNVNPSKLQWFRTLHSLAYQFLGVKRNDLMGPADYARIAKMMGQPITVQGVNNSLPEMCSYGDKLLFFESQARVKGITPKEMWARISPHESVAEFDLLHTAKVLERYKAATTRMDFVDLINRFVSSGQIAPFEIVIIDEAQDLSPKQWDMVELICHSCRHAYVAGDDDQAIYQWAGADATHMMKFRGWGEEIVLPVSYRVPSRIKAIADSIIERVQGNRVTKHWMSVPDRVGLVAKIPMWHVLDCSQGSWMFLARNQYHLEDVVQWCQTQGYTYETSLDFGSVRSEHMKAFLAWRELSSGKGIYAEQALALYDGLKRGSGYVHGHKAKIERQDPDARFTMDVLIKDFGLMLKPDSPLESILPRASEIELAYFRTAKRNIPIRISTIHGVKGAEADSVVLLTDMSASTYQSFVSNPDPEHRLWYVAVTRARHALYAVEAKNHLLRYELPL